MTIDEVMDFFDHYRERKIIAEYKLKQGKTDDPDVQRMTAIEACMAELPEGLGDILRMIYLEGQSLREIARKHYYSKDTIARRKREAIRLIATCLAEV